MMSYLLSVLMLFISGFDRTLPLFLPVRETFVASGDVIENFGCKVWYMEILNRMLFIYKFVGW